MATAASENTENIQSKDSWHIVKQTDGHCEIVSQTELAQVSDQPKTWGPFTNRADAIAKRVGLIRAGKCLPR